MDRTCEYQGSFKKHRNKKDISLGPERPEISQAHNDEGGLGVFNTCKPYLKQKRQGEAVINLANKFA